MTVAAISVAVAISHPAPTQLCRDVKAKRRQGEERAGTGKSHGTKLWRVGSFVWALTRLGRSVSHSWDHMCEHVPEGGTQAKGGSR